MDFIRRFFVGTPEEWVHGRFTRYGRGVYDGPMLDVKVGKVIKVRGSEEYCNTLGFVIAISCSGLFNVTGSITGKSDFRGLLAGLGVEFKDKSKKGVFNVEVSGELSSDTLSKIYSQVGDAAILLSLKSTADKDFSLKCKKKLPKPGGKKDSDFVSASLGLAAMKSLRGEVLFDVSGEFSEAAVTHKYTITDIIPPAGVKDPARIRVEAKRKGFVERKVIVDGKETVTRKDFTV